MNPREGQTETEKAIWAAVWAVYWRDGNYARDCFFRADDAILSYRKAFEGSDADGLTKLEHEANP